MPTEIRASQLVQGDTYAEYGMDEACVETIAAHGDTILITTTEGNEISLDADTVVERVTTSLVLTWRETTQTTARLRVTADFTFPEDETERIALIEGIICELDPGTFTSFAVLERDVWSAEKSVS